MTTEEVLQQCVVEGTTVKLPPVQLDRKQYMNVAKSLELIGGKWKGGKISGFVFPTDPTELLNQIQGGEKRNLKKEFQFFATPEELADELVELAEIDGYMSFLEPSAGRGAIINSIHKVEPNVVVDCCELMDINQTFLNKLPNINFLCDDFLDLKSRSDKKYDRIIANPPFSKNQDVTHVEEMLTFLKDGGVLVSVMSKHWQTSTHEKETEFRQRLDDLGAEIIDVDAGRFKESGTQIATCIVIIRK